MAFEVAQSRRRARKPRSLLDAVLDDLKRKRERVLFGFDFPLAFPRGTAAALKLEGEPWRALLEFVSRRK